MLVVKAYKGRDTVILLATMVEVDESPPEVIVVRVTDPYRSNPELNLYVGEKSYERVEVYNDAGVVVQEVKRPPEKIEPNPTPLVLDWDKARGLEVAGGPMDQFLGELPIG